MNGEPSVVSGSDGAMADEAELWHDFRSGGSVDAREKLFSAYAPFAVSLARRHARLNSGRDIEFGDLRQLAFAGLLEALDRFDPAKGASFRSFAAHRISGSIRDGIARMNEVREQMSWRRRVRRERMQSLRPDAAERGSTSEAMAELVEIAVGLALGFMLEDTGLLRRDDAENPSRIAGTGYDGLEWRETVTHLEAELGALPDRERTILFQHYVNGVGFDQLGAALGVTKSRVSQLHRKSLERLRRRMTDRGHFRLER